MAENKIKTETKSNIWKNVKEIALAVVPIVITILRKTKSNA